METVQCGLYAITLPVESFEYSADIHFGKFKFAKSD